MEVYLDNSATTRCYTEVGELVYKVMCQDYGNPSSMHRKGVDAEHYIKDAKEILAKILKVNAKEIYFTSGGTESDNLAIIGTAKANKRRGNHLITSSIEHPAILNTMRYPVSYTHLDGIYSVYDADYYGIPDDLYDFDHASKSGSVCRSYSGNSDK